MSQLVHLNVHTEYDRIRGGMSTVELAERVKELGMDTVAITDPGHMIGTLQAWKDCKAQGINPILGLEAFWCPNRKETQPDRLGFLYYPIVLLAMDNEGLKNLMRLSTLSWVEGLIPDDKIPAARVDNEILAAHNHGIICLTGNQYSYLAQAFTKGQMQLAHEWLREMKNIFGDRLYLQVPTPHTPKEARLSELLVETATDFNVKPVVAGLCLYAREEEKTVHEVKMATTMNRRMVQEAIDGLDVERTLGNRRISLPYSAHMMSEREVDQVLYANGLEYDLIETTREIADRCDIESYFSDRRNRYPKFKRLEAGQSPADTLKKRAQWGLYRELGGVMPPQEYRDRLDYELQVIKKMGYSNYMLIVDEYLEGIRDAGIIIGPGRGSAAGSLVSYALRITRLDPIKYGLIFERWLNIGRAANVQIFSREMLQQAAAQFRS